ncbi:hypothetical protein EYF80_065438 [Liparis tanakae]|uniref:Uncharacterized protein n=1 Tax=Liparis tanakae TaxID=230148 RepID=A0A4Z2E6P7_9TELE|nr:hypothetical protein EYF80_065438 [Liparis tanakae]
MERHNIVLKIPHFRSRLQLQHMEQGFREFCFEEPQLRLALDGRLNNTAAIFPPLANVSWDPSFERDTQTSIPL